MMLVAAVVFSFGVRSASAEPRQWSGPLTLAQAVQRAQDAGFDVRVAQADAEASAARVGVARAYLRPQVSLAATVSDGGITQLGMPLAQQSYLTVNASLPIFTPGDRQSTRAAARSSRAAAYSVLTQRNDAGLLATQGYERALLAQAVVRARRARVIFESRHVRDVAARVRSGDAARYQLFESRTSLANAQQSFTDASAEGDEAISDLEVTLDLAIAPGLRLSDTLAPTSLEGGAATFVGRAMLQRPEILAADELLAAAQYRLAGARARYLPMVSATARTYNGYSNPPLGAAGYQVAVAATLPVIDGGMRAATVQESRAVVARARTVLDNARLSVQRDVANAWREVQAARDDLKTARTRLTSAAEELRVTAVREQAGKGTTLELLSSVMDDSAARENQFRAVARFNDAVAAVHHAAGDFATTRKKENP
ncbi:MAG: TolC family protein [Candidatus Eremiobacteraeota bacterium]|nr:TolC family protein [Candidatus Eremiobacteraeota bacterium]